MSVESTFPVPVGGTGRPDYSSETHRGKQIYGYPLEPGESFFITIIMCEPFLPVGNYPFERAAIPIGGEVDLIDGVTGLVGVTPPAGYDYLIKQCFISFDQPVLFYIYQAGPAGYSCLQYAPAFGKPGTEPFLIGWARSNVEPINVASQTILRVRNLGGGVAHGKCWIEGFMKPGAYTWF
jgi:hypothetical protein